MPKEAMEMRIIKKLSRRELLRGSALLTAGAALAACGVSTTGGTPTTAPAAATQAPRS
jgi:nitrous oxide reductase